MKDASKHSKFEELRQRAEELIGRGETTKAGLSEEEMLSLIHELEVHQIELQVQHEELRLARQNLEESRKAYSDLFDLAPIGYVTINGKGTIVSSNLAAGEMLHASKNELVGRGFSSVIHPEDHNTYFELIRETTKQNKIRYARELRLLRGRTVPFYARVEIASSTDGAGHFSGWLAVFDDISDQKMVEAQLRAYAERLERSNLELENFAFVASHDLQEPLRKIQVFGDRLSMKYGSALGSEGSDYLQRMCKAASRLQEMVNGILDYSRVVTKGGKFTLVDLATVVRGVVSDLEWQINEKEGLVTIGDLPTIEADQTQMSRLFQNLLSNALKFHGKERIHINICSKPAVGPEIEPSRQQIFVEDNGIGFDQKYAERIFSLFERLHGRSAYEGTGIGLAICKRIAERHGGTITAIGILGVGATFVVTLPARTNHPI